MIPAISVFVRARGDHYTRSAVLLADSPPEAEDVVLEVADPADPADQYVLGAPVQPDLPPLQHRALEAVTIIERASSTTRTTCSPCWRNALPRLRVAC